MRGEVQIWPTVWPPSDGSMLDPMTGRFSAVWRDEEGDTVWEEAEFLGAEAAIAWGRERAEVVFVLLGNRGDTCFSAGTVEWEDDIDGKMPVWPPEQPVGGWWSAPSTPTMDEVAVMHRDLRERLRSEEDAARWALQRMSLVLDDRPLFLALGSLTYGWMMAGDSMRLDESMRCTLPEWETIRFSFDVWVAEGERLGWPDDYPPAPPPVPPS